MLKSYQLLLALLCLVTLSSCGPKFIVDEYQPVDSASWTYEDAKEFSFSVADTQQLYALHLALEHSPDFFAQNLYVSITTQRPDGSEQTDQVSLQMADKFGQWYGNCGRESCALDILIQPIAYFDQLGDYQLRVAQYSREEQLVGIQGLRFKVEELEQRR